MTTRNTLGRKRKAEKLNIPCQIAEASNCVRRITCLVLQETMNTLVQSLTCKKDENACMSMAI